MNIVENIDEKIALRRVEADKQYAKDLLDQEKVKGEQAAEDALNQSKELAEKIRLAAEP